MKFFTIGCVFYRIGYWDDLQIDPHVSLRDGFKMQFAGIVPVILELMLLCAIRIAVLRECVDYPGISRANKNSDYASCFLWCEQDSILYLHFYH